MLFSAGSLNNKTYLNIAAGDLRTVYGSTVPVSTVLYGGSLHDRVSSYDGGVSRQNAFIVQLDYRYVSNRDPSESALVKLTLQFPGVPISVAYTKVVTHGTLPDIQQDTIVFNAAEAVATSGISPGTVTVQRVVAPPGSQPMASAFASASEVHLAVTARSLTSNISYTRTLSYPSTPPGLGAPSYASLPAGSLAVFKYEGGYGVSYLYVVEPSCSLSGKLEVSLWGTVPLPGTPGTGGYPPLWQLGTDWPAITFQSQATNLGGSAPPYAFYDDYETAVYGAVAFPQFPAQLYDGPSHYYSLSTNTIRSGLPHVNIAIEGVS